MPKLPYQYVAKIVEEMYEKNVDLTDDAEIDKCCEFISAFIQACGWDESELMGIMLDLEPMEDDEPNKLN